MTASGLVHIGVVVAQDVGAISAHIVNIAVSVDVPEAGALGPLGKLGIGAHGDEAALGGAQMSIDPGGNGLGRPGKGLAALGMIINGMHIRSSFQAR